VVTPSDPPNRRSAEHELRYSSDAERGILRRPAGRSFRYIGSDGTPIRDASTLARIRALAIPPAWRDVWICRYPSGHLQAVGRDARGRKQPRYHAAFRRQRDELKFGRLAAFGRALPRIRRRVNQDLARPGLSRDKVLATVVRLLETTALRVGSGAYAKSNGSFGLTTLRNRHVKVTGAALQFHFRGKGGKIQVAGTDDRRIARIVARCGALPGQVLFQYLDAGAPHAIESDDVNAYLRDAAGIDVTAKDFRTWIGTLVAFHELRAGPDPSSAAARPRSTIMRSLESVAGILGNTPAVSRESYVAPSVVEGYMEGALPPGRRRAEGSREVPAFPPRRREELALIHFLDGAEAARLPRQTAPRR